MSFAHFETFLIVFQNCAVANFPKGFAASKLSCMLMSRGDQKTKCEGRVGVDRQVGIEIARACTPPHLAYRTLSPNTPPERRIPGGNTIAKFGVSCVAVVPMWYRNHRATSEKTVKPLILLGAHGDSNPGPAD